jgi:hypothetical protein
MDNQCCTRRKIFATAWLSTSVSFRPLLFLFLLAHTRVIDVIADSILYIPIAITVVMFAFLRWHLNHL